MINLPKLPDLDDIQHIIKKKKKVKMEIPKSKYDTDGNPILLIPDLDDVNLLQEIEKYLGEEDDE